MNLLPHVQQRCHSFSSSEIWSHWKLIHTWLPDVYIWGRLVSWWSLMTWTNKSVVVHGKEDTFSYVPFAKCKKDGMEKNQCRKSQGWHLTLCLQVGWDYWRPKESNHDFCKMELGCWSHADDGRCLCDSCWFDTARRSKFPPFPSLLFPIFWFSNAECNSAETGRSQWQLVVDLSLWNQVLVICVLLTEVEMLSLRWALSSSFIVCRGMPPSPKMRRHYHHSSVNCDQDSTWVIWHFTDDGSIRASSFWFLFHLHIPNPFACQINLFNMYQPVTNLPLPYQSK
jgi:hypothetical protein